MKLNFKKRIAVFNTLAVAVTTAIVFIVIFGMLRYAYQVHRGRGEDVARDLLRDPWIVGALAAWLLVFIAPLLVASA